MHAFLLAVSSLRARPVFSGLAMLSVATAIALLCGLYLLSGAVAAGFQRNAEGIDVVIGAKGSKLQLVLSSVYHADIPSGNIDSGALAGLRADPKIRAAIPLVIGDSYRGWRVVGTTPDYIEHYGADFAGGRLFTGPFEAVAGAATGLAVGHSFAAVHGLSTGDGDIHDDHPYKIVGVLKPSGTVLDRLILTSVESVQQLHAAPHSHDHEEAGEHEHGQHDAHHHDEDEHEASAAHQITAILVKTRSPLDTVNLPRQIDRQTDMMAAVPAFEMTRLSKNFGIGQDAVTAGGIILLLLSTLMMFCTLGAGLSARQYDLAVMRVLGASPATLFSTVMWEGLLVGTLGAAIGIASGHVVAALVASAVPGFQGIVALSSLWHLSIIDAALLGAGALAGFLAALPSAITAFKLDIAGLLARGT